MRERESEHRNRKLLIFATARRTVILFLQHEEKEKNKTTHLYVNEWMHISLQCFLTPYFRFLSKKAKRKKCPSHTGVLIIIIIAIAIACSHYIIFDPFMRFMFKCKQLCVLNTYYIVNVNISVYSMEISLLLLLLLIAYCIR